MARSFPLRKQPKPPTAPDESDIAKLAEVVQGLTHQVQLLACILDEIREELIWAIRNDKFTCSEQGQQYATSDTSTPAEEDEEEPYRPVDLSAMLLALQAALDFCHSTPLPGEAAEPEEVDTLGEGEETPADPKTPF